jgi:hypothetical protein
MFGKKSKTLNQEKMFSNWRKATEEFQHKINEGITLEQMYREAYWRGVRDSHGIVNEGKSF